MAAVRDLSVEELRSIIGDVVEEKLRELLCDPDEGLAILPEIRDQLLNGRNRTTSDAIPAPEAARRLGLEW